MLNKERLSADKSSAKMRGKRLRLVRKMSGLSLNDLAEKYCFGVSTIKYWECAKNKGLSPKGARKVILAVQVQGVYCSYEWLMHGVGLPPYFVDAHFGNDKIVSVGDDEKLMSQELSFFCENNHNVVTLTILDDGMEPMYSPGDSVGGKRFYSNDIDKLVGKDCIVETGDKQLLCRRIAKSSDGSRFNIYCINPMTIVNPPNIYDVELLSAAPISRIWRRNT